MKNPKQIIPPRWAQRFLEWYCRPELLEDLQGDLNEYFERHCRSKGARRAKLIYILDVFKFFRSYTIKKPEFINLLIHWLMLGSYIKTSARSIVRNKLFSSINIIGLAVSMCVGLLLIAMLRDSLSYDKFNDKHARIYRIISQYQYNGQRDDDFNATTSLKAATAVKETFTGIEDVAILQRDFSGDVVHGDKTIPLSGYWANESLFNVFSFELIQGNSATALKSPYSIVITEGAARKLFGDQNAFGKTLILNTVNYTVTGIMKNVPKFSHIKFDMLGSLSTRTILEKENKREMAWDNVWHIWAYVLLPEKNDPAALKKNLQSLSDKEDKTVKLTHIELDLQPMDDIMTGENLSNQVGPTIGGTTLKILGSLAFIVVLCACLNYTNLSIARSFKRSREVGIRKTVGALKSHVISQFVVESVIISLLALVLSFGLFVLIRPHFISVEHSLNELLVLDLSPALVFMFIGFALAVGISAGIFPALFFARINALHVLKNLSAIPVFKGLTLRKALIVFQYSVSIIAITVTLIFQKQYKHFIAFDLGFTTENILNIPLQGNKTEALKKDLMELPEVKEISQSMLVTSVGNNWGTQMKNPNDPQDSAHVNVNFIDENYLALHDHKLLNGRNFTALTDSAEEAEVIINQATLKRFNIAGQDPEKAIGTVVKVDGKYLTIVGVMKNFEYGRVNSKSREEVVMRYSRDANYLNVKINSQDWPKTYAKIESIWKKTDPVHPFEAKFYDAQIEEAFAGLKSAMKVGGFLAFLVICIASIGLFGMVVYTTEIRLKEISIRKVLGASEPKLLYLLSRGFMFLLLIAGGIALPLTYLFFDKILFPQIANHAPLDSVELFTGFLAIMFVALCMIISQTLKVARTNPAEILKNE